MKRLYMIVVTFAALLPASAPAQMPSFLGQWPAPRAVGIAFDPAGNIYVSEYSNYPTHIDVRAPDGALLAQWGRDGGDVSSVTGPYYIAADANGHLFIAEWTIHNPSQFPVQEFTTGGAFIAGVGFYSQSPSSTPGAITGVGGVAVGPDGRVYVTDEGNPRYRPGATAQSKYLGVVSMRPLLPPLECRVRKDLWVRSVGLHRVDPVTDIVIM